MLIEQELSREAPAKAGSNVKTNYQNKNKKASNSKDVHMLNHIAE